MEDLILRASFGEDREIWISDVSRETFEANEIDDLGTDFGYFLMTGARNPGGEGARILAKAASAQAAIELFAMLTSRAKRCAVLVDDCPAPKGAEIAQFPAQGEPVVPSKKPTKSKSGSNPRASAKRPSTASKQDAPLRGAKRASSKLHSTRDGDPPSKRRAKHTGASAAG